jgi:hypothetical protein
MDPEPAYTQGTSNTVSWGAVTARSPVTYFAERATDSGFTAGVDTSGWIPGTSYEFTGLTDGQIYYYRVKARDAALNESGWSNVESSTQDDSDPASSAGPLAAYQNNLTFDVPYTASDATSGVASVELFFQLDGGGYSSYGTFTSSPISFTATGDGFYEFYTVATDSVGNVETAPGTADASTTVDTSAPNAPTMTAEPTHTQGTANTVAWSDESGTGATEYYAEAATDAGFTNVLDNSGWIAGTSHNFTGLTDAQIYYYRAKARDAALNESGWSNVESSTQDDTAPSSSAGPLAAYQSNLTFDVPYTASDATSGVASVELFFQVDGGGYSSYGTYTSSPISFTASGDGFYDFYTVASDSVGNVEAAPGTADASTEVDTSTPADPVMDPEPTYTQGTSNTVSWGVVTARSPVSYWAERATDAGFTANVDTSGWIPGTSYEFTGLTDGQIYYYRVKARDAALNESGWSNVESSTQDDTAPASSAGPHSMSPTPPAMRRAVWPLWSCSTRSIVADTPPTGPSRRVPSASQPRATASTSSIPWPRTAWAMSRQLQEQLMPAPQSTQELPMLQPWRRNRPTPRGRATRSPGVTSQEVGLRTTSPNAPQTPASPPA